MYILDNWYLGIRMYITILIHISSTKCFFGINNTSQFIRKINTVIVSITFPRFGNTKSCIFALELFFGTFQQWKISSIITETIQYKYFRFGWWRRCNLVFLSFFRFLHIMGSSSEWSRQSLWKRFFPEKSDKTWKKGLFWQDTALQKIPLAFF